MNDTRWSQLVEIVAEAPPGTTVGVKAQMHGAERTWGSGAETVMPAASTIKLGILVALHRDVDAGRVGLDDEIAIEPEVKVQGSGVLTWLHDGLRLPVNDLAYLMIAISDNTASNVLMDLVARERVQATLDDLGLARTQLNRRFLGRMPGAGEPENVTCAGDLADLLTAVWEDRAASPEACARMRETLRLQQHLARIPRSLPESYRFAGKTGSVGDVVHDAGVVETPAGTLMLGVMTQGFATSYAAEEWIGRVGMAAAG